MTHVVTVKICWQNSEVGENENHSSEEVTNLVGPEFLLPCGIVNIGMTRRFFQLFLSNVLTARYIAILEDFMPYLWIFFAPPYIYLRNPNLRTYVWNLITQKNSVRDQSEIIELEVV